jgi:hypothetical protein
MWMVDPKLLCNNHLLGEHNEIHKHRHVFIKNWKITNRVNSGNVQIEPRSMKSRHDELALEMYRRWNKQHASMYEQPDISKYSEYERNVKVDIKKSLNDLCLRCEKCKNNIENLQITKNPLIYIIS